MSDAADRPFQIIVRDELATSLSHVADQLGARIAPRRSRKTRVQLGAAILSATPVPVLGLELANGMAGAGQLWMINLIAFDFFQIMFAWTLWQSVRTLAVELDTMIARGLFAAGIAVVYAVAREADRPLSTSACVASRTAWLGLVLLILGQPPLVYMWDRRANGDLAPR